jgi:hypothetical protein
MRIAAVLLLGIGLTAQTTHVIVLERDDAELIGKRYAAMVKAEAEFDQASKYLKRRYAPDAKTDDDFARLEYSADFRFMIKPPVANGYSIIGANSGVAGNASVVIRDRSEPVEK